MQENENIEFKELYTEKIYKEIVAFLNTSSGTIFLGYNDDGVLVGLENVKELEEKISNNIVNKIIPDPSVFISINVCALDHKDYIKIDVNKGIQIYSLKDKGVLKGTYIRNGSCSIPASSETVRQMIIKNSSLSFEMTMSNNQMLTFNYILNSFLEIGIDITNKNIMKNLHFINEDGSYTNLALLLSDQNPYTIKIAVYENVDKINFLDRKEFSGSLLEIYNKTLDYLKLNSATYGIIEKSIREDIEEYPEFILREIILNSLIHRDYMTLTSNIINIYREDSIEFISYGSLYGNITVEDILAGLSTSRNPFLQSILMRLKHVEAIGSGLRRVNSYYKKNNMEFVIKDLPSSFVVILPRITLNKIDIVEDDIILKYVSEKEEVSRKEVEVLIGKEKTTTATILNKMVKEGKLKKKGNGPSTRYIIKK